MMTTAISSKCLFHSHQPVYQSRENSGSYDSSYCYEPVLAPLSRVDWSHEPLLGLGDCDLPQPREWTLADIGNEVGWFVFVLLLLSRMYVCMYVCVVWNDG